MIDVAACGADGCWFQNHTASGHVDGLPDISVIDTTGAGDIFVGSAVSQILRLGKKACDLNREELEHITRFACVASGLSTTKSGGISSVPSFDMVLKIMEEQ